MKRALKLLCALGSLLIIFAGIKLSSGLPADHKTHIADKYAGWSGVLQASVCSRWKVSGNFIRWLNRCAGEFEKLNDGVYIEFMECSEDDLPGMREIYTPDMYFTSPGVITDPEVISEVYAVCMGAYAMAVNNALEDSGFAHIRPDTDACCFSAATITMHGYNKDLYIPDTAMDIGLPSSSTDADIFSKFIAGEIPSLAVNTSDIARLQRLNEAGRGPDWKIICPGEFVFNDQILYLMLPSDLPSDGRDEIIRDFAAFIRTEKCQAMLSDIGALPVCGENIYPPHSPYAPLEAALKSREIIAPAVFSEYYSADCENIVRDFMDGKTDRLEAVAAIIGARSVKPG